MTLQQEINIIAQEMLNREVAVEVNGNIVEATIETLVGELTVEVSFDASLLAETSKPTIRRFIAENVVGKLQAKIIQSV